MTGDADLREHREAIVREHMDPENHHDFETTLGTFGHPRYEIVPTGDVLDGADDVMRYFEPSRTAFPDQRNELIALYHADEGVIVEFTLKGTHKGELRGIPPTGKLFEVRTAAFFLFEGRDLVCERVYFDSASIMGQLGLIQPGPSLAENGGG